MLQQEQIFSEHLENLFDEDDFYQLEEREKSIGEIFNGIDTDGNGAISK